MPRPGWEVGPSDDYCGAKHRVYTSKDTEHSFGFEALFLALLPDHLEVFPWDHLDSGLDKDWLWEDWQDATSGVEVEDCRWTPCFDCGVCEQMGTEIQIGPTGGTMLGMPSVRRDSPLAATAP